MTNPEPTPAVPSPAVPGVDFYIEHGRYVFTAAYHLRRGTCCASGCRHCPYRTVGKTEFEDTRE